MNYNLQERNNMITLYLKKKPHKTELHAVYRRHSLNLRRQKVKCKGMERNTYTLTKIKQVALLILDKVDFKARNTYRNKKGKFF